MSSSNSEELAPASPVAGVVAISAVEPASLALDLLCKLSMAVAAASSPEGQGGGCDEDA